MSHDIPDQNQHPTGDGIAHLNALVMEVSPMLLSQAVVQYLGENATPADLCFFASCLKQQFTTTHAARLAEIERVHQVLIAEANAPKVRSLTDSIQRAADMGTLDGGFLPRFVCDCEKPNLHPHDVICRCGRDDDDDEPPTVLQDGYGIAPRLCSCGEESLDQTGDMAPWCSAECADNGSAEIADDLNGDDWPKADPVTRLYPNEADHLEGDDYAANYDRCPSPCGGHWGGCDECLNGPVASSKTPAKFADAYAVWIDRQQDLNGAGWEDREAWKDANPTAWEDFMDGQKAKVKDHITHAINADKKTLSALVLGWDELNCPNCGGESPLEFHEEGGGCVRVECGGLIPCFDEVVL